MTRNPGYTKINSAPPASMLPAGIRPLVEEFNTLRARSQKASYEAARFAGDGHAEQQARHADAEAVATATRHGEQLDEPNTHLLAHIAKRNQLAADAAALKQAFEQVARELAEWAVTHVDEIRDHAADTLESAAEGYRAIIPEVEKVATNYHRARGLKVWADQLVKGDSLIGYNEHSGGVSEAIAEDASQHLPRRALSSQASGF